MLDDGRAHNVKLARSNFAARTIILSSGRAAFLSVFFTNRKGSLDIIYGTAGASAWL